MMESERERDDGSGTGDLSGRRVGKDDGQMGEVVGVGGDEKAGS